MSYRYKTELQRKPSEASQEPHRIVVASAFLGTAAIAITASFFPEQADWARNKLELLSPFYVAD